MLSRLAYSTVSVLLSVLPVPALLNDSKSILTWGVLFFLSVLFFVFYSLQEYSMPDYDFESTKIVEAWILSQCFPGGGCAVWICAGFSFHSWALLFGLESEGRIFWKFHSGLLNSLAERGHWAFVEKLCVWANLDSEHSFGVSCKKELQSEHQTHQTVFPEVQPCLVFSLHSHCHCFFWLVPWVSSECQHPTVSLQHHHFLRRNVFIPWLAEDRVCSHQNMCLSAVWLM